jgi:hypothetical protein
MNLQESIRRILREERKLSSFLIRRLENLDYEVESGLNGPFGGSNICIFFKSDIESFESVMENAIEAMYYNYFSHIDDNSGEWAHEYLDMVDYIRNKYKDKIMKHYDDNCGSGSIPLKESIRRVLREETGVINKNIDLDDITFFKTSQGSKYIRMSDGRLRRWKSHHSNTGGEDKGLHGWSDMSIFVDPIYDKEANSPQFLIGKGFKIGLSKTQNGKMVVVVFDNGNWRPATWKDAYPGFIKINPENENKPLAWEYIKEPKVGYNVVDFNVKNNQLKSYHFGSEVSEVSEFTDEDKKLFFPSFFNMNLQESIRRILREETKIKPILNNMLNMLFDGFDDIYYDWANYNCGMGICCDPYAIGFVLPQNEYDDYLFKLVEGEYYDANGDYPEELRDDLPEPCHESPDVRDSRFDTIVFYEVFAEEIEQYLGPKSNWKIKLLELINKKFGCEATNIIFI